MAPGVRTFSQATFRAARDAWEAGEFDPAWRPFRELARERGFIYPPAGTRWDSWEDDSPSQRAILWRAIEETPELLRRCIAQSRSWSAVVAQLTAVRDEWRERNTEVAAVIEERRRADAPGRREAAERLGDILRRAAAR